MFLMVEWWVIDMSISPAPKGTHRKSEQFDDPERFKVIAIRIAANHSSCLLVSSPCHRALECFCHILVIIAILIIK
jgi:hypothetical protein